MAVTAQNLTDRYAIYNGDCVETMASLPDGKIHLSLYSPPFCGMYQYSSGERDLSNCSDYGDFFKHYEFVVRELSRVTMPGRMTAVHCMDVPSGNTGRDHMVDFPGDIIRLHERLGWKYTARYAIWKDPFVVYLRTLQKNIRHRTVIDDSARCSNAAADYLLLFRREGENPVPIAHPIGLLDYVGAREVPKELLKYRAWEGKQTENKYSQWIWRQYASAFWDDVRLDRVLPYKEGKDPDDERHVHPLQLDVIERCVHLWTNPGENVLTPFMGVGSEVYGAVINGRRGIGIELKPSYYRQALRNLETAGMEAPKVEAKQVAMFATSAVMDDAEADSLPPAVEATHREVREREAGRASVDDADDAHPLEALEADDTEGAPLSDANATTYGERNPAWQRQSTPACEDASLPIGRVASPVAEATPLATDGISDEEREAMREEFGTPPVAAIPPVDDATREEITSALAPSRTVDMARVASSEFQEAQRDAARASAERRTPIGVIHGDGTVEKFPLVDPPQAPAAPTIIPPPASTVDPSRCTGRADGEKLRVALTEEQVRTRTVECPLCGRSVAVKVGADKGSDVKMATIARHLPPKAKETKPGESLPLGGSLF